MGRRGVKLGVAGRGVEAEFGANEHDVIFGSDFDLPVFVRLRVIGPVVIRLYTMIFKHFLVLSYDCATLKLLATCTIV